MSPAEQHLFLVEAATQSYQAGPSLRTAAQLRDAARRAVDFADALIFTRAPLGRAVHPDIAAYRRYLDRVARLADAVVARRLARRKASR